MRARAQVFVTVVRNPALRRIGLAFAAFSLSEWATWVAVIVYAYGRGGAAEAGVAVLIQMLPSLVVAPMAAALGDRYPRRVVLTVAYAVQGVAMAGGAAVLFVQAPAPVIYAFATLTATAITLTRPLQAALLPEIVDTTEALTAANVASGTVESVGSMAGPAVAAGLLAIGGPFLVFAACSAAMLAGSVALVPIARAVAGPRTTASHGVGPDPASSERARGIRLVELPAVVRDEVTGGLRAIAADEGLLAMTAVKSAGRFLLGALDILYAVLAIDLLRMGEEGVGLLGAVTGVGMLVGSLVAVGLVGARRLAPSVLVAAGLAGVAVSTIAVAPIVAATAVLLAVSGGASTILFVGGQTLTQRLAPPAVRTRVFGVLEGAAMAMTAAGALAVPALIHVAGTTGALVVAGLVAPLAALAAGRPLARAERTIAVPAHELARLRAIPMFALLAPPTLERLASELRAVRVAAGAVIVAQGAAGDGYYLVDAGVAEVSVDGQAIRRLEAGAGFGEIALIRDVPRTATVTAITDVDLLVLDRVPFLEAITGQPASHDAAEQVIATHLAATT